MKRLGVDVGGTFTDLILVDEDAGRITRPQGADHARMTRLAAVVAGVARAVREGGRAARRRRQVLPRHDGRDQHRAQAQRRRGRDDHDRGLPRHPPHRPPQEAAATSRYQDLPWQRARSSSAATA